MPIRCGVDILMVTVLHPSIVEEGVYCGTGVKIINQIQIGEYSTIGAGAVVVNNLPAHCTAVGVPAKVIKHY